MIQSIRSMIDKIDDIRAAAVSMIAAITGTTTEIVKPIITDMSLNAANTAFQHLAWTIAIIAGITSICINMRKLLGKGKKGKQPDEE